MHLTAAFNGALIFFGWWNVYSDPGGGGKGGIIVYNFTFVVEAFVLDLMQYHTLPNPDIVSGCS
jgi:hypothetical protein